MSTENINETKYLDLHGTEILVDKVKDLIGDVRKEIEDSIAYTGGSNISINDLTINAIGYKYDSTTKSFAAGENINTATGNYAFAEGNGTEASGKYSHAEGNSSKSTGEVSHSEGYKTTASGKSSHAEGNGVEAIGLASHAEGWHDIDNSGELKYTVRQAEDDEFKYNIISDFEGTTGGKDEMFYLKHGMTFLYNNKYYYVTEVFYDETNLDNPTSFRLNQSVGRTDTNDFEITLILGKSIGKGAHIEGCNTVAYGDYSHAEGNTTRAAGSNSHTEGSETASLGVSSHAEGRGTVAIGEVSHSEGYSSHASGYASHTEGSNSHASGYASHAEGSASAEGNFSHAEGTNSRAKGESSHAEGYASHSEGYASHSEGSSTVASGAYSHAEGYYSKSIGDNSHAEGYYTKTGASASHAEGSNTIASGAYSHTEGASTVASGSGSHAEGIGSQADGNGSHAEGNGTHAYVVSSHTEGESTVAHGLASHAEGQSTTTHGLASHAEGQSTTTHGLASHAEGNRTTAIGDNSHAEGYYTTAEGWTSHTEGNSTKSIGIASHAEGYYTTALGRSSHSEGESTKAEGYASHAEGSNSNGIGYYSHAEGNGSQALGQASHAEGRITTAEGKASHAEGDITKTVGEASHAEGNNTITIGNYSHTEGLSTTAEGESSHAEGNSTKTVGEASHAEGSNTTSIGNYSHTEGLYTISEGWTSHAEGDSTKSIGTSSHAEGSNSQAVGNSSHTEGFYTTALSQASHAEGYNTTAEGLFTHTEGKYTKAVGEASHAEGNGTIATNEGEHAEGKFNITNIGTISSIGIGTSDTERKNAFEVMENGDTFIYGVGDYDGTNAVAVNSEGKKGQSLQEYLEEYKLPQKENELIYFDEEDGFVSKQLLLQDDIIIIDNQEDYKLCTDLSDVETDVLGDWQQFTDYKTYSPEYGSGQYSIGCGYGRWYSVDSKILNPINSSDFNGYMIPFAKSSYSIESIIGTNIGDTTGDDIGFSIVNDKNAIPKHIETESGKKYYRNTLYDILDSNATSTSPQRPSRSAWVSEDRINNTAYVIYTVTPTSGDESYPTIYNEENKVEYNVYYIDNIKTSAGRKKYKVSDLEGNSVFTEKIKNTIEASGVIDFVSITVTNSSSMQIGHSASDGTNTYTNYEGTIYVYGSRYNISDGSWTNQLVFTGNDGDLGRLLVAYNNALNTNLSGTSKVPCVIKTSTDFSNGILTVEFSDAIGVIENAKSEPYNSSELKIDFINRKYFITPREDYVDKTVVEYDLPVSGSIDDDFWSGFAQETKFMYHAYSYQNLYIECLNILMDNKVIWVHNDGINTEYGLKSDRKGYEIKGNISTKDILSGSRLAYNSITKKLFYSNGDIIYRIASSSEGSSSGDSGSNSGGSSSSQSFTLTPAKEDLLGGIMVGSNLSITDEGVLTAKGYTWDDTESKMVVTGKIHASGGFYETSDARKKDVQGELSLDKAYDFIRNCEPILYNLKGSDKTQIGLIAQEVREFFPEIVNEDSEGYLTLDYAKLTVIILRVLKDLIDKK